MSRERRPVQDLRQAAIAEAYPADQTFAGRWRWSAAVAMVAASASQAPLSPRRGMARSNPALIIAVRQRGHGCARGGSGLCLNDAGLACGFPTLGTVRWNSPLRAPVLHLWLLRLLYVTAVHTGCFDQRVSICHAITPVDPLAPSTSMCTGSLCAVIRCSTTD